VGRDGSLPSPRRDRISIGTMSAVLPPARPVPQHRSQLDCLALGWGAALLLFWDKLGWDLDVSRWFGDASGFVWRDAWVTSTLLHQGGRVLAWCVVAVLVLHCWRPLRLISLAQDRRQRIFMLVAVLLCMALVPALKRFSATSCPWDLQAFGGVASYVSHWDAMLKGMLDAGPGRCFPSGHAVAAFGFLPVYFTLRQEEPQRARHALWLIVLMGLVFGVAQLVRGAHYVSHILWSAWLCWLLAAGTTALAQTQSRCALS
jgi:membrane-associated PAP2 superfamily phosphatase